MNRDQKKLILYSGIGGLLEFYDFIIYALLAPILASLFFPSKDHLTAMLATFATFSVGYLVRPIGGIIFAHFGDKHGRKNTFMATIILMAFSTFAIGLIPTYQSMGIMATSLLVALRVLQGFSVGGEIPGAITYISESMPEKRGIATAIIFFFLINGITLGSLLHYIIISNISPAAMMSWGWRLLFFVGGGLGLLGFFLRKKMLESPLFIQCEQYARVPFLSVLRYSRFNIILTSLIAGLGAAYITVLYLFLPAYFKKIIHYVPKHFLLVFTLAIFIASLCAILFGWISQKVNKPILIGLFACIGVLAPMTIFQYYISHQYAYLLIIFSCLLIGGIWGVIPSLIAEFFPTHIRYSGIATCYNLAFAIFGGLAPVISILLIKTTGKLYSPAYYLILLSILVLLLSLFLAIKQVTGNLHPEQHFKNK